MLTEFFIEGNNVDVSENFSTLITYAIDDVKDFGSKNTSYSKTIILPGTARNNKIFGNIFDATVSNPYDPTLPNVLTNFNAAKSARCLMFQGNIQVFKGVVRILEIIIDRGRKEYEVAITGELGGLISALGNKKLEDLDFSAYDHVYSLANIVASWNNPGGSGYYYPLMDYGTYSINKHDWDYHTLRPALYLKEYIDKIAAGANYSFNFPLSATTRFKSIIIPHNKKQLVKNTNTLFDVSRSTNVTFNQTMGVTNPFPLPTLTTIGNFTANITDTEFTYVPSTALHCNFYLDIQGTYSKANAGDKIFLDIVKNTFTITFGSSVEIGTGFTAGSFSLTVEGINSTVNQNDIIKAVYFFSGSGNYSLSIDSARLYASNPSATYIPIALGETIPINDSLPQNILQVDFLSSILKLSNLYLYDDKFDERKVNITPYVDFYNTDPTTFEDWTYKLNRDKPIKIKPLSELNSRYYEFKMAKDSDFYNDQYSKRYNENYGDFVHDNQYEFANEKKTVQIIFSGTPLLGYLGEDKIYSTIFKQSGTTEENIDCNIRILQAKKIIGVSSWNITDGPTVLGSYTNYGYAGHLDDPDAPANDLNFGAPKELYFTLIAGNLSVNQFNVYYSSYMAEITDKDSKLLTASFRLNPTDIFNLDFSRYKWIDGSLFRLNKITDYNASVEDECEIELLKVINTIY